MTTACNQFTVFVLVLLTTGRPGHLATQWRYSDYPNPHTEPQACGRTTQSHICDPDAILSDSEANKLDEMIDESGKMNTCACADAKLCNEENAPGGYPIKIAFLKNISISKNLDEDGQKFVDYLKEKWSFGSCDNSIVILIVQVYHRIFISAGEEVRREKEWKRFQRTAIRSYDTFESIESEVRNIIHILYGEDTISKKYDLPVWILALVASAAVLMVLICIFIICKKCRVKPVRSTADLPWSGTRVKIFSNLGRKKKMPRSQQTLQKY